jgi:hypothetical protein
MPLLKRKKVHQLAVPPITLPEDEAIHSYLSTTNEPGSATGSRETFDGVVLPSPHASSSSSKVWQPAREARRLLPPPPLPAQPSGHTTDATSTSSTSLTTDTEPPDDARLRTLLTLKQKQADLLLARPSKGRAQAAAERDPGKVPLVVGDWREDEVWYIKQTGEIFHDYE